MTGGTAILPSSSWGMAPADLRRRDLDRVVFAVVHHSATTAPDDHAGCRAAVWGFDDFHRRVRGWAAIGYHRVVCPHGVVFEGRPLDTIGAHSEPANVSGVGYCLIGGPAGHANQAATLTALVGLARAIRHDQRLTGRGELRITDHRRVEPGTTTCPGQGIENQLPDLRRLTRAPEPKPAPKPAPPPFPGRGHFRAGHLSVHAARVAAQLVRLGFDRHRAAQHPYQPNRGWTRNDVANLRDFQRSRPELRDDADGYPGPLTWRLLHTLPSRGPR